MEVDRFTQTAALTREVACQRYNLPAALYPTLSVVEVMGDTDGDLAPLLDAKTGIEIPAWASVKDMPHLTTALKRAAAMLALDERSTFSEAARPPSSGKKGAKPPADARPAVDVALEVLEASDSFSAGILQRERALLRARLQAISARAAVDSSESEALLSAAAERMQKAMQARFVAECESVASLVVVLAKAVVAGEQLPYDLRLSDDGVIIDMGTLVIRPPSPKEFRPPSPGPLAPGLLSLKQIRVLVSTAQEVTTCEFMHIRDCTQLLQQLSGDKGGRFGVAFPEEWQAITWKQMHEAIKKMDAHMSCYIDWLEMTTGLLIHARPEMIKVTANDLAEAAVALSAADSDGDGAVTLEEWMGCPMWFEPSQFLMMMTP